MKQSIIIVFLSVLFGCATSGDEELDRSSQRGDCIHQPSIRGYRVLDEQNLIVSASARKQYHVKLDRRAHGLRSSWSIGFVDASTGRVCPGFSQIVFNDNVRGLRHRIVAIRLLTPEEEEDLLIRFGLKEPEVTKMPVPQEVEGADIEELDPDADE